MCKNCSSEPAMPAHIRECLGLTKQDLADVPLLVLDFLKVKFTDRSMRLPVPVYRLGAWGEGPGARGLEELEGARIRCA
ncbi:hypothetical protein TNCV_3586321 [Trichonephila clavipes]|nr:hypothetical protein TNCV_3586321 [Trichonephila clavipes]